MKRGKSMLGHTHGRPRQVTAQEVQHYAEHGWVKLERFLTPALAAALVEEATIVMNEPDDDPESLPSYAVRVDFGATSKAKVAKNVVDIGWWHDRRFVARDDRREPFYSLALGRPIGRNVQRLVGRDVPVQYGSDIIACKQPAGKSGSAATSWHQDLKGQPHDRSGALNIWIAMAEVTPEQGSLRFLDKSHCEGLVDLETALPRLREKYKTTTPMYLRPGDATAHHGYTVHGAPANETLEPRWGYILSYFPADVRYTGVPFHSFDNLGLVEGQHIVHPNYPIIYS
jgi:Phytanoyl-CoA dioxygenase (PhyH)